MLVLTRGDIANVLTIAEVIDAVEEMMRCLAVGTATEGVRTALAIPGAQTTVIPMMAATSVAACVKVLTDAPDNPSRSLPRQQSVVLLIDPDTSAVEAILDGAELTRLRTAAASAVATKHLSRPDASTLGLIGAGALAIAHLDAIRTVRPVDRVVVWTRSASTRSRFVEACRARSVEVVTAATASDVAAESDIVCTLTPARHPVLFGASLRPGMHVNAVGAPPRDDHREIDDEVISRSRLVVDNRAVALAESGAIRHAIDRGVIDPADVLDELGDVVAGRAPARTDERQITLFNSVGLGSQDLAAARLMVATARRKSIGHELDLTARAGDGAPAALG